MKTLNYTNFDITKIASKLNNSKWMLKPLDFDHLCKQVDNCYSMRVGGLRGMIMGDPLQVQDDSPAVPEDNNSSGNLAMVSVNGILSKGVSPIESQVLGLTDVDNISSALDEVAADPTVESIIMNFATPGGETLGIEELGRKIKNIDTNIKPVYGWTEVQACSAGYWLLSNTRKIGMTPSSQVGAVGVYMLILNELEKMKKEGIDAKAIYSGKYKLIGHAFHQLTEEEESILENDVKKQHEKFKAVVKASRPNVNDEALEGLSYEAEDAMKLGLVDSVHDSLNEYLDTI